VASGIKGVNGTQEITIARHYITELLLLSLRPIFLILWVHVRLPRVHSLLSITTFWMHAPPSTEVHFRRDAHK